MRSFPPAAWLILASVGLACTSPVIPSGARAVVVPPPVEKPWPSVEPITDLAPLRFVDGGPPSAGARSADPGPVTVEAVAVDAPTQAGPLAWTETRVTLLGRKQLRSVGVLEVALPAGTLASEAGVSGTPMRPLHATLATRSDARTFRTEPLTLEPGERKVVVLRHAFALGDAPTPVLPASTWLPSPPSAPALAASTDPGGAALVLPLTSAEAAGARSLQHRSDTSPNPTAAAGAPPPRRGAIVLCDTSAARRRDLGAELSLVRAVASALEDEHLVVAAYDEAVVVLYDGPASKLTSAVGEALLERGTLGSSDTPRALRAALENPALDLDRAILVTDGADSGAFGTLALDNPRGRELTLVVPSAGADLRPLERVVRPLVSSLRAVPLTSASVVSAWLTPGAVPRSAASPEPAEETVWPVRSNALRVIGPRVVLGPPTSPPLASTTPAASTPLPAFVIETLSSVAPLAERPSVTDLARAARRFKTNDELRTTVDPMEGLSAPPASRADATKVETSESKQARSKQADGPAAKPTSAPPAAGAKKPPTEELPTVETDAEGPPQIPPETIQWIVRKNFGRFRGCYREALRKNGKVAGRVVVRFDIDDTGSVPLARAVRSDVGDVDLVACVVRSFEALSFPPAPSGALTVEYPLSLSSKDTGGEGDAPKQAVKPRSMVPELDPRSIMVEPWQLAVKTIHDATDRGDHANAIAKARELLEADPTSPAGYVLLGDAYRRAEDPARAERAYRSLLELDLEDRALNTALRLLALDTAGARRAALALALDATVLDDPSPEAFRVVAALTAANGDPLTGLQILDAALGRSFDPRRHPAARDLLRADLAALAAVWMTRRPEDRLSVRAWAAEVGVVPTEKPASTVSATWVGSSDMDLVVRDIGFNGANKSSPTLASGGRIVADVDRGRGPEGFVVENPLSHPYWIGLRAKLDRAYAFGSVLIVEHDGAATLRVRAAPFDLNVDGGSVDVTRLEEPICPSIPCRAPGK
jgi:hypothetical protein